MYFECFFFLIKSANDQLRIWPSLFLIFIDVTILISELKYDDQIGMINTLSSHDLERYLQSLTSTLLDKREYLNKIYLAVVLFFYYSCNSRCNFLWYYGIVPVNTNRKYAGVERPLINSIISSNSWKRE